MPDKTHTATAPGKGTGLFTASPIPAYSPVLSVPDPLVTVPDDAHLAEACSWCLAWKPSSHGPQAYYTDAATPLMACTGCRTVRYCGKACQRGDWKNVHKSECKIFQRLQPRVLPASVRATVRLLLLRPAVDPERWNAVMKLQSHVVAFAEKGDKWQGIILMAKGAHAYSETSMSEPEVLELYCRVMVNTVTLTTPTLDPIGLCFSPEVATINHSCAPNTSVVFSGRSLELRSLENIPGNTELTITYIDLTCSTGVRQSEVEDRYFFTCRCAQCLQAPDVRTDTYKCPATDCGYVTIIASDTDVIPKCGRCGQPIKARVPYLKDLEAQGLAVAEIGNLKEIKALLQEAYKTKLFASHRQPVAALHQAAVQRLLAEQRYAEALKHQLLLYTVSDPVSYPGRSHPVRVCRGFVLAALLMEVARDPPLEWKSLDVDWARAVWAILSETEAGVAGSHGKDSGFAKVVGKKKEEVKTELQNAGVPWISSAEEGKAEGLELELKKVQTVVSKLVEELRV